MPSYDSRYWDWGKGFCTKHRGQAPPCRMCIDSGDPDVTVTEDANAALSAPAIEVVDVPVVATPVPASGRYPAGYRHSLNPRAYDMTEDELEPAPVENKSYPGINLPPVVAEGLAKIDKERFRPWTRKHEPAVLNWLGSPFPLPSLAWPHQVVGSSSIDPEALDRSRIVPIIRERIRQHTDQLGRLQEQPEYGTGQWKVECLRQWEVERLQMLIHELETVLKLAGLS